MPPVTLRDAFTERLIEFRENFACREQQEAARLFRGTIQLLDLVVGEEAAALGSAAIRRIIKSPHQISWQWSDLDADGPDKNWVAHWTKTDETDIYLSPFLDDLHDLNAFANFGIMPLWNVAGRDALADPALALKAERLKKIFDVPQWVVVTAAKIDRLEQLAPRDRYGQTYLDWIIQTRNQARARLKLDLGKPITIADLAALSGVTVKTIQDAIDAKTEEAPNLDQNGLITPAGCDAWLNARDFRWSLWRQVQSLFPLTLDWGTNVPFEDHDVNDRLDDFVFVPVAGDGSFFNPGLKRKSGFMIGARGGEKCVESFLEALSELQAMATPRWRRPNFESGNWGIVSGHTWKRMRLSDLERTAQ